MRISNSLRSNLAQSIISKGSTTKLNLLYDHAIWKFPCNKCKIDRVIPQAKHFFLNNRTERQ